MESRDKIWRDETLIQTLMDGGVAVMPTDTVYGMVCKADNKTAVSRVYTIRKRNTEKPCIILISESKDLEKFEIELSKEQRIKILEYWPGPVSIGFDCANNNFTYLHRGTNSLVFRMPAPESLQLLLESTGPLIAPSANPEGDTVAKNIIEAKTYFGELVDFYADAGDIVAAPSKIIKLNKDGTEEILRD